MTALVISSVTLRNHFVEENESSMCTCDERFTMSTHLNLPKACFRWALKNCRRLQKIVSPILFEHSLNRHEPKVDPYSIMHCLLKLLKYLVSYFHVLKSIWYWDNQNISICGQRFGVVNRSFWELRIWFLIEIWENVFKNIEIWEKGIKFIEIWDPTPPCHHPVTWGQRSRSGAT